MSTRKLRIPKRSPGRPPKGTEPDWEAFVEALRVWPFKWYACEQAGCTQRAAEKRAEAHADWKEECEQAELEGASRLEFVYTRDAFEGWAPDPKDAQRDERSRPDQRAQINVLRALLPEKWKQDIGVVFKHDLADIRAMTREQRLNLGRQLGVV